MHDASKGKMSEWRCEFAAFIQLCKSQDLLGFPFKVIRQFALAAVALLLVAGCGERLPTYRYRLSVEVETPEGLRTGSSVIEVRTHEGGAFPGPEAASTQSQIRGEAVTIDLGQRGVLFALLTSADRRTGAGGYAWALLPNRPTSGGDVEARRENYRALRSVRGSAELPTHKYPMLVRFRDLSDPRTVEQIEPTNLDAAFGSGVRLQRITVAITDDPPTEVIQQRLSWLGTSIGYLDGQKTGGGPQLSNILETIAFKRDR